jgi:pyridoxal 5'-phosphate synthase pdxS subunit
MTGSTGTFPVKRGLAEMLKGGVIMDVVTPAGQDRRGRRRRRRDGARAGARRHPPRRRRGPHERPEMIEGIQEAVSIPVMAKARIGHFVEAQILQALGVDFVDESEVLTPADETHHIDKFAFDVPFVCGATNLGEALRRISEGAAMIRSKGEAGTGNVVEAVRHLRNIIGDIRKITQADEAELFEWAKRLQAPLPLVQEIAETGKLQVPLFCAGGLATPADAALAMQLGAEAVFVGSGIFKSEDPSPRAKAIVEATTHFRDADILAKVSRGLGAPMTGIEMDEINQRYADRGW